MLISRIDRGSTADVLVCLQAMTKAADKVSEKAVPVTEKATTKIQEKAAQVLLPSLTLTKLHGHLLLQALWNIPFYTTSWQFQLKWIC